LPKRVNVIGEWRRLHYEEQLYHLYSSQNIIRVIKSRRMRWVGRVVRIGDWRDAYRISVGRHEGKRPLGRPRRRWEDNIKMDIQEIVWAWIDLAQYMNKWRDTAKAIMILRIPQNLGNFLTSSGNISYSKRTLLHGVSLLDNISWGQRTYSCLCKHCIHSYFSLVSDPMWDSVRHVVGGNVRYF